MTRPTSGTATAGSDTVWKGSALNAEQLLKASLVHRVAGEPWPAVDSAVWAHAVATGAGQRPAAAAAASSAALALLDLGLAPDAVHWAGVALAGDLTDQAAHTEREALTARGLGHRGCGRYDEALSDLNAAVRGDGPVPRRSWVARALLLDDLGRRAEAYPDLDLAIAAGASGAVSDPVLFSAVCDDREIALVARRLRGQWRLVSGDFAAAAADFAAAVRLGDRQALARLMEISELPDDPAVLLTHLAALRISEDFSRAAILGKELLARSDLSPPVRARVMINLGHLGALAPDGLDPAAWMLRAVEAAPDDPEVALVCGRVLVAVGRGDEAVGPLRRAVDLAPGTGRPEICLGDLYAGTGRPDWAAQWYEQAAGILPCDPVARFGWALALVALGQREQGAALARRAAIMEHPEAIVWCRTHDEPLPADQVETALWLLGSTSNPFSAGQLFRAAADTWLAHSNGTGDHAARQAAAALEQAVACGVDPGAGEDLSARAESTHPAPVETGPAEITMVMVDGADFPTVPPPARPLSPDGTLAMFTTDGGTTLHLTEVATGGSAPLLEGIPQVESSAFLDSTQIMVKTAEWLAIFVLTPDGPVALARDFTPTGPAIVCADGCMIITSGIREPELVVYGFVDGVLGRLAELSAPVNCYRVVAVGDRVFAADHSTFEVVGLGPALDQFTTWVRGLPDAGSEGGLVVAELDDAPYSGINDGLGELGGVAQWCVRGPAGLLLAVRSTADGPEGAAVSQILVGDDSGVVATTPPLLACGFEYDWRPDGRAVLVRDQGTGDVYEVDILRATAHLVLGAAAQVCYTCTGFAVLCGEELVLYGWQHGSPADPTELARYPVAPDVTTLGWADGGRVLHLTAGTRTAFYVLGNGALYPIGGFPGQEWFSGWNHDGALFFANRHSGRDFRAYRVTGFNSAVVEALGRPPVDRLVPDELPAVRYVERWGYPGTTYWRYFQDA